MCDLVSGAMAAISAISAITGAVASAEQEKAQAEAMNEANLYNTNQAIKEQQDLSNQEGIRQQQERQSLANERLNLKRENMQKAAAARASSKAEGTAYDLLIGEYGRISGNNSSVIDQQLAMQDMGHAIALKSYEDRAKARIGGLQGYRSFSNPWLNGLGAALQIGGGALDAYNSHETRTGGRSKTGRPADTAYDIFASGSKVKTKYNIFGG